MSVSQKQIEANQRNAQKSSGPKTPAGKEIASRNSLKHGLLAKEVVITNGEGRQDPQFFHKLLDDLLDHYKPVGPIEEMKVESIAACYMRLTMAQRYEVGAIRRNLDTVTDDFYANPKHRLDVEIDAEIAAKQQQLEDWQTKHRQFEEMISEEKLENIYYQDWVENWLWIYEDYLCFIKRISCEVDLRLIVNNLLRDYYGETSPRSMLEEIHKILRDHGYQEKRIWQLMLSTQQEHIDQVKTEIDQLIKEKQHNRLQLESLQLLYSLPEPSKMNPLLRYNTTFQRQMNQEIQQLERLQRLRAGEHVPAPVQININVDDTQNPHTGVYTPELQDLIE